MTERINIKWVPDPKNKMASEKAKVRKARGLSTARGYGRLESELGIEVCDLPPGIAKKDAEDILMWLKKHPLVMDAEPEGFGTYVPPVSVEIVTPQDEAGAAQGVAEGTEWWQIFVRAPQAWTVTKGAGTVAAITDNGLGPHPFTDPLLVESKIFDLAETDFGGGSHGNPVTGCDVGIALVGGITNYKIAGTDVKCSWTDVANAWLHAKAMGRKVVNTSWGGGSSFTAVDAAIKCKQAGMAIICAAGNSGDATQFPANNANVYAVSALDSSGNIAGFSCRGKIDISAPGVGLLTTTSGGGWAHFSGTSGAAPIITGLIQLILSKNPSWTGVQAMEHLMSTATPKEPKTDYGAGIPNAAKAVGVEETIPEPPPVKEPTPIEPPTTEQMNLTKSADIQSSFSSFSQAGEGLDKIKDANPYTKCLHFNKESSYILDFHAPVFCDYVALTSANDYPQRDPQTVRIYSDEGSFDWVLRKEWLNVKFDKRYERKEFNPVALSATARRWKVQCISSGETSPGDTGSGILQIAELEFWGQGAYEDPPTEPPEPNPAESYIAAIETLWPSMSDVHRDATKSRIVALP